jgi:hypothetical protein
VTIETTTLRTYAALSAVGAQHVPEFVEIARESLGRVAQVAELLVVEAAAA